ncbi:MAG: prepilin-type N-terminal cleavage/methylation domain-containing protein, partial [Candidatus Binatia bacterium]
MRNSRGFSLLEVIVATAVMAVALVACLELFTGSIRVSATASHQTEAMVLAGALADETLWRVDLDPGEERGREGDYDWSVVVSAMDPQLGSVDGGTRDGVTDDYELRHVEVTVSWKSISGPKSLAASTGAQAPQT